MRRPRQKKIPLETQLGHLAMQFRSTRKEAERAAVAKRYEDIVNQLIERGKWKEMPTFEDMLPDEWMPEAFFKFWSIPSPPAHNGHGYAGQAAMTIRVTYPLFIVMDGKAPVIVAGEEGNVPLKALAVFTDREAAEQYRDEYFPKGKVVQIPDEESFAKSLTIIRDLIALVAFDPYSIGKRMMTVPVDEMLRQLPDAR